MEFTMKVMGGHEGVSLAAACGGRRSRATRLTLKLNVHQIFPMDLHVPHG
jgi:hypothetical protein